MKKVLFWQTKFNFLDFFTSSQLGSKLLVILNYLIWLFLFFIFYLLIHHDYAIFWTILLVIVLSEIFEKLLKKNFFWPRPISKSKTQLPKGLVNAWYQGGSFPSGHSLKSTLFFLLVLQYGVFSPVVYLLIILPLLFFRILISFHYPIDILGGIFFGYLIWLFTRHFFPPDFLLSFGQNLFS
ncbi:hypothetical protein DRH14_03525, partial [Candidatus Shapirobacteria bacterium]